MANLGQDVTAIGRARSKKLKNAVSDNHPVIAAMKANGGIKYKTSGRDIVEEAAMAQNSTAAFIGKKGTVSLADTDIMDAAYFPWTYLAGTAAWSVAEKLQNRGENEYINLIGAKYMVLEETLLNVLHGALIGDGTTALYPNGLSNLIPATVNSGTVGGMDVSAAANAWYRTQSATSTTACGDASLDAANILRAYDYALNLTIRDMKPQANIAVVGSTHWPFLSAAFSSFYQIVNKPGAKSLEMGWDSFVYRGCEFFNGGGITFSSQSQATAAATYFICTKPGGINLVYMKGAEFDLLDEVQSADQAAISRMNFTMMNFIRGGLAKFNYRLYNG